MPSLPIVPTQVALWGNVGSVDAPRGSQLFTFDPRGQGIALRGSGMVPKNQQKIGKPMVCPVCPLGPHRSQKQEMWVLWTFSGQPIYPLTFGPRGQGNAKK